MQSVASAATGLPRVQHSVRSSLTKKPATWHPPEIRRSSGGPEQDQPTERSAVSFADIGQTAIGSLLRRGYKNSLSQSMKRERNSVDNDVFVPSQPEVAVTPAVTRSPPSTGTTDSDLIFINCSGFKYVTTERTLARFPNSLLGDPDLRAPYWSEKLQAYYFDRPRGCFESILQFYQTGIECPPPYLDLEIYLEEKDFWKIKRSRDHTIIEVSEKTSSNKGTISGCSCCPTSRTLKIHMFLVNPTRTIKSSIYHVTDIVMICIATVLFVMESEPSLRAKFDVHHPQRYEMERVGGVPIAFALYGLNAAAIAWFTMDIVLRMATWPVFWNYWKVTMNVLDIFSVLPFYIELVTWCVTDDKSAPGTATGYQVLRILRLIRVIRVFKFIRHSESVMVIIKALIKARKELIVLFVSLMLFVITFGAIMFYVEEGVEPSSSGPSTPFSSILMSCWWVLVSITTVGFGDMYPTTVVGKFLGSVVLCLGIICLALPMTIIVTKFSIEFDREKS